MCLYYNLQILSSIIGFIPYVHCLSIHIWYFSLSKSKKFSLIILYLLEKFRFGISSFAKKNTFLLLYIICTVHLYITKFSSFSKIIFIFFRIFSSLLWNEFFGGMTLPSWKEIAHHVYAYRISKSCAILKSIWTSKNIENLPVSCESPAPLSFTVLK